MLDRISRSELIAQTAGAAAGMLVWLFVIPELPVFNEIPGVALLLALLVAALTLDHRPGTIAVIVGVVGFELTRPAQSTAAHVARGLVFASIGGAVVALAYARTMSTRTTLQYHTLFERHPLPMWVYDEDTLAFLAVNGAAVRAYGFSREEFAAMTLRDVFAESDRASVDAGPWHGHDEWSGTWRHQTKGGQFIEAFVRSQSVSLPGHAGRFELVEDVTERRSVEDQLRQSQKMEAIGQLAGGIAHDFNNLLTAIRGYAALLIDALDPGDERREDAMEIDRASARAADLTRQLLAFGRKQLLQMRVVSLSRCIEDAMPMVRVLVGEGIELTALLRATSRIHADPTQLQQVLMNLVVNARDAVGTGGRITVETDDVVLDANYLSHHSTVQPGPHAVLIVSDDGHGMDAQTRSRVFEPFFTTKAAGQGTGLGLATVYGIVRQSGGHVWVYSEVGHGTTFKIYFPQTTDSEEQQEAGPTASPALRSPATILLVEDEVGVRTLMTRLLEGAGYTVLAAQSPPAAREIWSRPDVTIHLLITDVVLPEMSGAAVAEAVRRQHPQCPVLFISGYAKDGVVTDGVLHDDVNFLQKPFTTPQLLNKVAAVLTGNGPG